MINIYLLRVALDETIKRLSTRGGDVQYLREVAKKDDEVRVLKTKVEKLKSVRNETSKKIGQYKRNNENTQLLVKEMSDIGVEIKKLDDKINGLELFIEQRMLETPNIPHLLAIEGKSDVDNVVLKTYAEPTSFPFPPQPHWELAAKLNLLDFDAGAKITGTRFTVLKGLGARLERALLSFMMDLHSNEHGYTEIIPPFIVNDKSLFATGQLPKFGDDLFKLDIDDKNYYLNPTAEVPTINIHRNEILQMEQLPLKYVSFTTAFRKEAGAAGKDTRGIIRQHQFNKVELIQFSLPELGYEVLDEMLTHSEKVLQLLKLPYRVVELCTGDLGAGMAKTYDIEVWLPSYNEYKEIASISNATTYQARRANIRFKRTEKSKTEYVHTLNGSGLAVGRTLVAVIENYQQADGTVVIPEVLVPYMGKTIIQ